MSFLRAANEKKTHIGNAFVIVPWFEIVIPAQTFAFVKKKQKIEY